MPNVSASALTEPPALAFVSVEAVCRHCRGTGRSRYDTWLFFGWCSGWGVLKVARLRQVTELPDHGKIEDQN